jgi:hypothetical protein
MKSPAEILLQESQLMLAPLVRALLQQGITYPQFSASVKQVFLDVARKELRARNQRETDSAVSVLSGIHRKEVRALGATTAKQLSPELTLASQIFTRWVTDPVYRDKRNRPRDLPRSGSKHSFDALVISVSKDVHPRTALEELVRLEMVTVEAELVRLNARAFVPRRGFKETAALLSHNVADHLAAGTHNLTSHQDEKFLEQSIFANGLTVEATERLGVLAREVWMQAFETMVPRAEKLVELGKGDPQATQRMRFGTYFYAEETMPLGDESKSKPRKTVERRSPR